MIRVKRTPTPGILNGPTSKGGRELARWQEYYDGIRVKKPGISAYNEDDVIIALRKMFHNKCCYCEMSIPAGDVEHYRPKNAIIREDGTRLEDGYWWLAAVWENLLYACPFCNQRRKQQMHGDEKLETAGKGAFFPIENTVEVKKPGDEIREKPLLLNPCDEAFKPEEFFSYETVPGEEEEGYLQPVVNSNGELDQRGMKTIEIFGLNEVTRVEKRRDKIRALREEIQEAEDMIQKINDPGLVAERDQRVEALKSTILKLKSYLSEDKEDVQLARQMIRPLFQKIKKAIA